MDAAGKGWNVGWPAPAKLNLVLHVTGRRPDGYHLLETAFQFVDLCDEIHFTRRDDGRITRSKGPPGVAEGDDLTVRAARLLCEEAGVRPGLDIAITKRIPLGGGLGGGSSDAATTLVALNHLLGLGQQANVLMAQAARLGADVPVFVGARAAWAEGIGDVLTPAVFRECWYVIVHPGVAVATHDVFRDPELTRNSSPVTITGFLSGQGRNDCEMVVRRRYPEVGEALDWLADFGEPRLTGTGACVFLACEDESEARRIRAEAPMPWTAWAVRGMNQSPVLSLLTKLDQT